MKEQGLERVLEKLLDQYLDKKDPIRHLPRKVEVARPTKSIPVAVKHEVSKRDQGKCQWPGSTNTRYVELHHKIPRLMGGEHTVQNLTTLCSAHHRAHHFTQVAIGFAVPEPK